ncbi:MAG: c-type cytochrome biogenesis protein CcmI [Gammaproteobacteria bacterium]|nr:c-type cytochrome biogenesis protein CcmI [Gammaproteobacteria bacterium]
MLIFILTVSVLILLALLFVVPALLKSHKLPTENFDQQNIRIARERMQELKREFTAGTMSQEVFDQARIELEQALAIDLSSGDAVPAESPATSSRVLGLILMVAVPLFAILVYLQLGRVDSLNGELAAAPAQQDAPGMNMTMDEAIAKLKTRLEQDPSNAEGWYMLARSYVSLQRYADSLVAYRKTIALVGDDADLLLRYADALVMSHGGRFAGEPTEVINKALLLSPDHPQGLWLAGMAASEAGKYQQALQHWYKLEPLLAGDAASQTEVRGMIANVEQQLTPQQLKQLQRNKPAAQTVTGETAGAAEITVQVDVDASVKSKINPSDTVFILARAISGPPMPLAVVRHTAGELPLTVKLNDAMAMMPEMRLSSFPQVRVTAIVSKAGTAQLMAGDLFGEVSPVKVAANTSIKLQINQVK